jgi:hypothetical protein
MAMVCTAVVLVTIVTITIVVIIITMHHLSGGVNANLLVTVDVSSVMVQTTSPAQPLLSTVCAAVMRSPRANPSNSSHDGSMRSPHDPADHRTSIADAVAESAMNVTCNTRRRVATRCHHRCNVRSSFDIELSWARDSLQLSLTERQNRARDHTWSSQCVQRATVLSRRHL